MILAHSHTQNDTLVHFVRAYEEFLNSQSQWKYRAEFSIQCNQLKLQIGLLEKGHKEVIKKDPYGLRARCGFCGQCFDAPSIEDSFSTSNDQKLTHNCPKCRNQLPRCAICLGAFGLLSPSKLKSKQPGSNFFVWCQKCRHGGHVKHIEEWFGLNTECPVSECTCSCNNGNLL